MTRRLTFAPKSPSAFTLLETLFMLVALMLFTLVVAGFVVRGLRKGESAEAPVKYVQPARDSATGSGGAEESPARKPAEIRLTLPQN